MDQVSYPTLLYDGHCPFCRGQVENLKKLAGKHFTALSFQDENILSQFSVVTYDECMKEIKLVLAPDHALGGAHAIFYTLSYTPWMRPLRWLYPLPLFKQIFDFVYGKVAENRYKIKKEDCPDGTCSLKVKP